VRFALHLLMALLRWTLILVLLALAGMLALVFTEDGTRWLFAQAERHAPAEFHVGTVDGTLFRGLALTDLEVGAGDTRVTVDTARIGVDAFALLRLHLRVQDLDVSGIRLDLPAPETPQVAESPSAMELPESIALPLRVTVERFRLDGFELRQAEETVFTLDRLALRLDADPDGLRLEALELEMPGFVASGDASLRPAGAYPLRLSGHWRLELPENLAQGLGARHAEANLAVEGDLLGRLELRQALQAGPGLDTELIVENLLSAPKAWMTSRWMAFPYRIDPATTAEIAAGELTLEGNLDDWTAQLAAGGQWAGLPAATLSANLGGSLTQVELRDLSLRSEAGRLDARGRLALGNGILWEGWIGVRGLSGQALDPELDAELLSLQLATSGSLPRGPDASLQTLLGALEARAEIRELRARVGATDIEGSGRLTATEGKARFDDMNFRVGERGTVRLDGEADLGAEVTFRAGLAVETLDLAFLLNGRALALERLRLAARGQFKPGTGVLAADIALEEMTAVLDGRELYGRAAIALTETEARIGALDLELSGNGLLSVTGRVGYSDGLEWDLALWGKDIDPGVVLADLPGSLAIDLSTDGVLKPEDELRATLVLRDLQGELRGQPIEGAAQAAVSGSRVQVERLDLRMGANRLTASGGIGEILDLELALNAPELERVLPSLSGRLELQASLSGTRESPRIAALGQGEALRYDEFRLGSLDLRLDAGLDPAAPAEIDLRLSGLTAGAKLQIDAVRLDARGTTSSHGLSLAVDAGPLGQLQMAAAGGYDPGAELWAGRLESLELDQPLAGPWSLRQPAALSLATASASLGELCLDREQASLCVSGGRDAAESRGQGTLRNLNLSWLDPLLPAYTKLEGRLDARFQASLDAEGLLQAEIEILPGDGVMRTYFADGAGQSFPYRDGRLVARIDDRVATAEFSLSLLENGEVHVSLGLSPEGDSHRIEGEVLARLETLEWLSPMVPGIEEARGRLRADLELGGLLASPLVRGTIEMDEAGAVIPELGLNLEVPTLLADVVSADEMRVYAELRSGGESLRLEGELGFSGQDGARAELKIEGESFLAANRPDILIRVSPDLTATFSSERLTVRGEVRVPSAMILPPDLPPGAVTVSRDEIVIGEDPDGASAPVPIDMRVRLLLGDDVRFNGFGLEARFSGDLDLVVLPERPPQLFGEVAIPQGSYRSYGQDLNIERGLVLFQGPPESPSLDILAVRRVRDRDVVVGLEIGGTPQELRSRVFSEPSMDDTEAMSFLLTGRPLSGASRSDGNLIASAVLAWGVGQAGLITQRLGRELGVGGFELETGSGLNQSAMTIGTSLSPDLLLRYSVGLLDATNRVLLRYQLTRALSVETTSSTVGHGIDLIFRIER
jgi:translocation and assembly module TamB